MTWLVVPPDEGGVILMTVSGRVEPPELQAAFTAAVRTCLEHDRFRVLCDVTALEAGHTVLDMYALVTSLAEAVGSRPYREAVVVGSDPAVLELARFFETASVNRGLHVRVFDDRDAASAWLSS